MRKSHLIKFDQVWSSLSHFGQIWSKKIKNKTAIFILFKNVSTLYANILWYMQPLKSSQTQTDRRRQTQTDGNTHRHRSSNSSLDMSSRNIDKMLSIVLMPLIYLFQIPKKGWVGLNNGSRGSSFRALCTYPICQEKYSQYLLRNIKWKDCDM